MPIAALQALTANINRDSKKRPKPFTPEDFALFRREEAEAGSLSPEVAATALALRAERKDAPILLAAWDQVLASASETAVPPEVRALHSDDRCVWLLCPKWEHGHIRAGLVAVADAISGPVKLRDIDRPLATYTVVVPDRRTSAWLEAELLLLTQPER